MDINKFIKPYSKTRLARAYGVDLRTFNRWLKSLDKMMGKPNGRLFTPLQVKYIFEHFGRPNHLNKLRSWSK
jgi:hypothetical protein